jgi:DNA-binding CsgD family transcriptional regulator
MLVGRGPECARIDSLLADAREGRAGTLVLRGEPGIGKSALLGYADDRAGGMTVLHARGIESEAELAFSGLLEIARPILNVLPSIPKRRLPRSVERSLSPRRRRATASRSAPPRSARLRPPPSRLRSRCSSTTRSGWMLRPATPSSLRPAAAMRIAWRSSSPSVTSTVADDEPGCFDALRAASAAFDDLTMPFERARSDLYLGERLRRAGKPREAREPLHAALVTFDELAAEPWGERPRKELRASGGTVRRRDPSAGESLTPQELQIALAVARGKTNREAGAELFLSPKTIEAHLSRVYRKLGITSRTQLVRLLTESHAHEPAA